MKTRHAWAWLGVGVASLLWSSAESADLFSLSKRSRPFFFKHFEVPNANVIVSPGDLVDPPGVPGDTRTCVLCQYEDKVAAHPALSVFGTALLMGGLVTAMLCELRKRQVGGARRPG